MIITVSVKIWSDWVPIMFRKSKTPMDCSRRERRPQLHGRYLGSRSSGVAGSAHSAANWCGRSLPPMPVNHRGGPRSSPQIGAAATWLLAHTDHPPRRRRVPSNELWYRRSASISSAHSFRAAGLDIACIRSKFLGQPAAPLRTSDRMGRPRIARPAALDDGGQNV